MDVMYGNDGMKPKEYWNAKQILLKEYNVEQVSLMGSNLLAGLSNRR